MILRDYYWLINKNHSIDSLEDVEWNEGSCYLAGQETNHTFFLQLIALYCCQLVGVSDLQLLED